MPDEGAGGISAPEQSRGAAVRAMRKLFETAGLETPDLDARLLASHVMQLDSLALALSAELPVGAAAGGLEDAARRRLAREPVARIIGNWEFYGLPLDLDAATLVPRPETETIVDAVLAEIDRDAPLRLLDLGTGSGAILIALLDALPQAFGLGVDLEPAAVRMARRNAAANGVADRAAFVAGSWMDAIDGSFDLVVGNPPYIASGVIVTLAEEVRRHDPWRALDGGADGLDAYRSIACDLHRLVAPGGRAVFEIGHDQADCVSSLFVDAGFAAPELSLDLGGRPRAVIVRKASASASIVPSAVPVRQSEGRR